MEETRQATLSQLRNDSAVANLPTPGQITRAGFDNDQSFALAQRGAKLLASSDLVPKRYQGNIANCMVALEMAQRIGASPLMVMQNLYIVHGQPAWSGQFVIAAINQTKRFSSLRYEWQGSEGNDNWSCRAWAIERQTGERLQGPMISIAMAKMEGWYEKKDSKWPKIPELMLMYRAGAWFGRTHAPEVTMGLQTSEEVRDVMTVNEDGSWTLDDFEPTPVTSQMKQEPDPETGEIPGPYTYKSAREQLLQAGPDKLKPLRKLIDMIEDGSEQEDLIKEFFPKEWESIIS